MLSGNLVFQKRWTFSVHVYCQQTLPNSSQQTSAVGGKVFAFHPQSPRNKVVQCAWAKVTTGMLIRKDGHGERRICMLTKCNEQWEHSGWVLYQARLWLTYTSCLFWVLEMRMVSSFHIKRLFSHILGLEPITLFIFLSHCESLSLLILVWTVSCRMSCFCWLDAFTCLHSGMCVYVPSRSSDQWEYDWAENCWYSWFWVFSRSLLVHSRNISICITGIRLFLGRFCITLGGKA